MFELPKDYFTRLAQKHNVLDNNNTPSPAPLKRKEKPLPKTARDWLMLNPNTRADLLYTLPKYNGDISEHSVQEALLTKFRGSAEVETPVGRADIVTHTRLIEIKRFEGWKAALGQLFAYHHFLDEDLLKSLVLFNPPKQGLMLSLQNIVSVCRPLEVSVLLYLRNGDLIEFN